MSKCSYFWFHTKRCWRYAVDLSFLIFVVFSLANYLGGNRLTITDALSNLRPFITVLIFIIPWLFFWILMACQEINEWKPLKQKLCYGLYIIALFFSCYFISINKMIPSAPLSNWICNEAVGWTIFGILTVSAIVIFFTGENIVYDSRRRVMKNGKTTDNTDQRKG